MSESEQQIREHNERELWRDVANHLQVAYEAVEQAQGSLSDLDRESVADLLDPVRDLLRRAADNAADTAREAAS